MFRGVIAANAALSLILAAAAVAAALFAANNAVIASARADIEAEIRILEQYREGREIFNYAEAVDYRILPEEDGRPSLYVYMLARSDHSPVVGNLAIWPETMTTKDGWARFDGASAGAAPGAILARIEPVGENFSLIVGRRLKTYDALRRNFVPLIIVIALVTACMGGFFSLWIARRFQSRVAEMNAVFDQVRKDGVEARLPAGSINTGDELSALGGNINLALDEISRLMKGLDAVSQTAAHELNKEVHALAQIAAASGQAELERAASSLHGLLREILELSRVEATPGSEMAQMALADAVAAAVELYQDAYDDKGVQLEYEPNTGARILGRAALITNMTANLLDNALKHTPAGGVVRVLIEATDKTAILHLSDTGIGADTDDLGELIRRGARGPVAGYGFGLRFVQAVAIRHGARIRLSSSKGGLKFHIVFPKLATGEGQ